MLRPPGTNANDRRPTRPCKGDSKGKHKDNGYRAGQPVRRAYITENDQAADPAEHQEDDTLEAIEQEPQNQDADPDPPEEEDDLSNQINEIMTVTARKLAGVIQARKFGTPPAAKKSVADRKRTTHCAACGQQGHWQGDPSKKGSKGQSKGKADDRQPGGKGPKTVHFMNHQHFSDDEDTCEPGHASHQVFVAENFGHEVLLADATKAAGFVILDTACQRMCAGEGWVESRAKKLEPFDLEPFYQPLQEFFEFGKGPTISSEHVFCFPASFGGQLGMMSPCILKASIPCLASQPWMTEVGTIIDLAERHVCFSKLHVTVPLLMINGHIAIDVPEFKQFAEHVSFWKSSSAELQVKGMITEWTPLLHRAQAFDDDARDTLVTAHAHRSSTTSAMASRLEAPGEEGNGVGQTSPEIPSATAASPIDSTEGKGEGSSTTADDRSRGGASGSGIQLTKDVSIS